MTFQTAHTPPGSRRLPAQTTAPTGSVEQPSAALREGVTALKRYYQPTDISPLDHACALEYRKRATSLLPEIGIDRWVPKIDASFKKACESGDLNTARTLIDIVAESKGTGQILVEWDKFVIFHGYDELKEPISTALSILNGWPSSSAM